VLTTVDFDLPVVGAVPALCPDVGFEAGLLVTVGVDLRAVPGFTSVAGFAAGLFVTLAGVRLVVLVFGCVDDLVAGLFVTLAGVRLVVLVFCSADDLVAGLFVTGAGARLVITAPEVDWEPDLLSILFPEGLSAGRLFCSLYILVYKTSPSLLCSGCEYVLL